MHFFLFDGVKIGTREKKRRREGGGGGEREKRKKMLAGKPAGILQNAFAHKCRALIGADGSDVCQLLVSHIQI